MGQETARTQGATGEVEDGIVALGGVPVLRCAAVGPVLDGEQAALDLIFSRTHAEQTPGHDTGAGRAVSAPIVETVNRLRNVGAEQR